MHTHLHTYGPVTATPGALGEGGSLNPFWGFGAPGLSPFRATVAILSKIEHLLSSHLLARTETGCTGGFL